METFLREKWRGDRPALGLWCTIGAPLLAEALAAARPDYVCVDMQHGESHNGNLVPMLQAVVAGGSTPVVRVTENSPGLIMKALDAGAHGIVVPLVESGKEAAEAVAACRYPPHGRRSFGPFRASIDSGTSDPTELENVACVVMVETRAGIDNLAEIVATDGLTGVYIGPSDLSLALGLPPGSIDAPEFAAVVEDIRTVCVEHGVVPGIHSYDGHTAARYVRQGFGMITVAVDLRLLRAALTLELGVAQAATQSG